MIRFAVSNPVLMKCLLIKRWDEMLASRRKIIGADDSGLIKAKIKIIKAKIYRYS
jgi:hypothetical protein